MSALPPGHKKRQVLGCVFHFWIFDLVANRHAYNSQEPMAFMSSEAMNMNMNAGQGFFKHTIPWSGLVGV